VLQRSEHNRAGPIYSRILEFDSFDFIERNLIFGPIVESGGAVEMLVTMMGLTPLPRISRASGRR
jgi:hypothetical protein